jgi:ketosteroid isomerase-like protein
VDDLNRLASFLGLMTQSNSDEGPDSAPPASDRATAWRFGVRIASAAQRWRRGGSATDAAARRRRSDSSPKAAAEVVLQTFHAVERRDDRRLLELYHPDVEFHWPASLPYGGSSRGNTPSSRPTWAEVWDPLQPTAAERQMTPRVIAASPHEVAVLWRQRGVNREGDHFECEVLGLYGVRDGRFARAQMFYFDTETVKRFLRSAGVRWSSHDAPRHIG